MRILLSAILLTTMLFGLASIARAVETDSFSTLQTGFDANILANDLIENGSSALSSVTTTGSVSSYAGDVAPPNAFDHLTDGGASTKVSNNDISKDTYFDGNSWATNPSTTYTFSNPLGESLTSINSISGWADTPDFSHQVYDISLALVGAPNTFVPFAHVDYNPWATNSAGAGGANSSQVNFSNAGLPLATGVAAIRFSFLNNNGAGQVFREIDVTGVPTPEPASLALFALGGVGLLVIARRRRRA